MDDYIKQVENLFSAAKNVFKNLNFFYFHNCLYEGFGKVMLDDGKNNTLPQRFLGHMARNTNVFLLVMLQ